MLIESRAAAPGNAEAVIQAMTGLSVESLEAFAQKATGDGGQLRAHLGLPRPLPGATTFHIRCWNVSSRSLSPSFDGELEVRPLDEKRTGLMLTAQYRPAEPLRELANPLVLRSKAQIVLNRFVDQLVDCLRPAPDALVVGGR